MEYRKLGDTALRVSRLCFGTLTMGPLQKNLSLSNGVGLLELAFSLGINFVDTAELYGTYPYIREALKQKPDAILCTKSYSYDAYTAESSFRKAVEGMGREYIDIFLLHEQESEYTLRGHYEAIEYFLRKKQEGHIGEVGISTHYIAAIKGALKYPELTVLFPLINISGIGIADGSKEDMLQAIDAAQGQGKGIFAMKPFGGGHLIHKRQESLEFLLQNSAISSIAIGMQTEEEVRYNCACFAGGASPEELMQLEEKIDTQPRSLLIHDWCEGCGRCVSRCKNKALAIINGKAQVQPGRCALCGYCAEACPQFCIKVI